MSEPPPKRRFRSPFRKILVANRGEIAVRVLRAARERGITGAVVYSEPDRASLPVLLADEAHLIGPALASESYLRGEAIIDLAERIGADAIHPGYGFLAENASFAQMCVDSGVAFIGPPAGAIAAMGSKLESRRLMQEAGVPVIPGGYSPVTSVEDAASRAEELGFPVMVKASAGGGGKGLRRVSSSAELGSAFRGARSEAAASFGDDTVYLEKYIERPRHVELQVLADRHGQVVSLGERECSIQRRHQKVIEEAPSPVVDPELRRRMGAAAVAAAAAVGYENAGTVEFLLAATGEFFFLEMNTRLQVEHPVTELVTGLDLVRWQIAIAEGRPLPPEITDTEIEPHGHAIEVRIYAENPDMGFAPSPGRIERLRLPQGPGVRNDCGVYEGSEVSIYYDPMMSKLIVHGRDRGHALERLERALAETRFDGVNTALGLYRELICDDDFRQGRMDIGLLERKIEAGELRTPSQSTEERDLPLIIAALEHLERQARSSAVPHRDGRRNHWREAARIEAAGGDRWN
ncbi:MAG: acetyl-CoA carboxylase biotin carboxylase subunit [Acidobacteriota bacterium]|nr:acetyl-CoA carboxylase biotin carboxylase subunit [Acidobacteriota bacterium]